MKKVLISLAVILGLVIAGGYLFRQQIFFALMSSQIAPDHAFSAESAPVPPDYADDAWWAALPTTEDPSDQRPAGVERASMDVAVFFVHPTSYFGKDNWNQPLSDDDANWIVDHRVLRHQASVFNSCCDIFAPRYRQATFFSFMDQNGDGEKALALAYGDVVAAFRRFVEVIGSDQPFVVAGHSQGSRHAAKLVAEHIAHSNLRARMVAAYLVGFSVSDSQLGGVPVCTSAEQTGCALGWNVMDGAGEGAFGGVDGLICTNPLNWRADTSYAAHELNRGAIGFANYGPAEPDEDYRAMSVEVGVADAQCQEDGQLAVMDLRSASFPARMFGNSMHVYDYSLFHASIRDNVRARIEAFLRQTL